MLRLCVNGAIGRMGTALSHLILESTDLRLVGALVRESHPEIGKKIGDAALSADMAGAIQQSDALIDFSTPESTVMLCEKAMESRKALVIGTTGLSGMQEKIIAKTARQVPIVYSGNFSLGVNVLATLVERAAAALPIEVFDLEIFEAHHRAKLDAPSGTALLLGRAGAAGRGQLLDDVMLSARHGHTGVRKDNAIGFSVARGGDVVGEHTVFFYGMQEQLELTHRATDRSIFARGALHAARWVTRQPAGLYSMRDVLGLSNLPHLTPREN